MTNNDIKEALDKALKEFRKSVMESMNLKDQDSALMGLVNITYSQAFVDGANFVLDNINLALPKE